jgi:hypothetical protein
MRMLVDRLIPLARRLIDTRPVARSFSPVADRIEAVVSNLRSWRVP